MELAEKLELFGNMVLSCHRLYLWTYDLAMRPISTNCPDAALINALFSLEDKRELMLFYSERHTKPIVMSNRYGMMWIAVPEHEGGRLSRVYVLGPFFVDSVSTQTIQDGLGGLDMSANVKLRVTAFLRELPVVTLSRAFEYAIMLHYCVHGESIAVSDIHFLESEPLPEASHSSADHDIHGTWEMEREAIRMVREGNLDYRRRMDRLAMTGSMGKLSNAGQLRQMKNAVLVCIVLFSRAAIEGGLSPEVALTLSDRYFQSAEAARNMSELSEVAYTMQEDYVMRVHKLRTESLSRPVRDACDHIALHLTEELTLESVAAALSYSPSYLSRRFKEETGSGVKEYIRDRRLERAMEMLTSGVSVKDTAEALGFNSMSYFGKSFREKYGKAPSEVRP